MSYVSNGDGAEERGAEDQRLGRYDSAVIVKSVFLARLERPEDYRGGRWGGGVGGRAKRFTIALAVFYRRSFMFLKVIIMIRFPGCFTDGCFHFILILVLVTKMSFVR